jgi:signal transduction histidine kinase
MAKLVFSLISFLVNFSFLSGNEQVPAVVETRLQADTNVVSEKRIEYRLLQVNEKKNSDIKQAMQNAKKALEDAEILKNKHWIAESKLAIGICYDYLGANVEALQQLKEALALFTELNDKRKIASTLQQIGNIYYNSEEYLLAMEYFKNVFSNGKILNDTLLIIEGNIGRGTVYGNTNKMDSAMLMFNDSYLRSKEYGNIATEVQSLYFIGDVYLYSDRPREALGVYHDVEHNYDLQKINSKLVASLYNSITLANIKIEDIEKAKYYSQKTEKVLENDSRLFQKMTYFEYKFRIDTLEKNYRSAIKNYISYKKLSDSINNSELKKSLANFEIVYELKRKESEVNLLKDENKLKDLSIRQKRIVNYGSITLVMLLIVIVIQTVRDGKKIKLTNNLLQMQGEELAAANEELTAINEQLFNKQEALEIAMTDLQSTQKQLIQSEKMASLGLLASGVAHEINNPLNFIHGGILGIEDCIKANKIENNADFDFYIKAIRSGVDKAVAIISGLNQFSSSENHLTKKLDLHNIIDTCLLILHHMTLDRIEIIKKYSGKPCIVTGNETKLHQAIFNILLNAVQAIGEKGQIIIESEIESDQVKISVSDTGCGISERDLPKVFDPFFTTKAPGKGTGLGLAVTYNLLLEHKGTIDLQSVLGKGTTAIIILPVKCETI